MALKIIQVMSSDNIIRHYLSFAIHAVPLLFLSSIHTTAYAHPQRRYLTRADLEILILGCDDPEAETYLCDSSISLCHNFDITHTASF
jgi:hypothetical protein